MGKVVNQVKLTIPSNLSLLHTHKVIKSGAMSNSHVQQGMV